MRHPGYGLSLMLDLWVLFLPKNIRIFMCGIVGHIGSGNSVEIVLEGLKRLEYRGYDSAGISFVDQNSNLHIYKKSGKLENLRQLLKGKNLNANISIGHTRWATHGEVNDVNSHPHTQGQVSIVHNGIIENADRLRNEMAEGGFKFQSQTDSEVFLALVHKGLDKGMDLITSVAEGFKRVEGNSAFVVMYSKTSEIVAVKRGAPLVCGVSDFSSELLVSSDPFALVGIATTIFFPEDEVLCSLGRNKKRELLFLELNLIPSKRYLAKKQMSGLASVDKGEFEHYMLKEIHEQPELVRSLTQYYFAGEGKEVLFRLAKLKPQRICISACGTAAYAGLVIRDYFEKENRIACVVELASEFRYRNPIISEKDLAIFISQSGETADTLASQTLCKSEKVKTVAIVNVEGSTLYRQADANLLIKAGVEIGVASTKAFTQMALTGRLLAMAMKGELESEANQVKITKKFSLLAERIDALIARTSEIKNIAEKLYNKSAFFFTGRGSYFPIALEGALKLKEIAYVHAEGYAAGELKHGPIALIDETVVNIAIVGPELFDKTVSNIQEIKARKGIIVAIGPEDAHDLKKLANYFIGLNFDGLDELAPVYVNVCNQLLAYYMAKAQGTDIDKPRNLAKSVTVE